MCYNFTAIFEKGEKYYIRYCVEIPEANGQGKTIEDRKVEVMKSLPKDVIKEEVKVE